MSEYWNQKLELNFRHTILLLALAVLPNFFGLLSFQTPFGFRIHFFQYLIFLAAAIYGPIGGAATGMIGSVYTAAALNNPYVIIGNAILGFFAGAFIAARKGSVVVSAMAAYVIQLPWLWVTDVYLVGMPLPAVKLAVVSLLVSNLALSATANLTYKPIKEWVNF